MGSGAAFLDYDNDGFLDLYIVNGAPLPGFRAEQEPRNSLYRNQGDGTFARVTEEAGVGDTGYGMGVATGDYDNDADQDLYVTNYGPNVLYRNEGDGTFADVTELAGVGDEGWGTNAVFVDYDADGRLDLYVANYMEFNVDDNKMCLHGRAGRAIGRVRVYCGPLSFRGQSGVLYRNNGDDAFTDVTREAGLYTDEGRQLGVAVGDYDNDGDPDLFVANDKTPSFLFRNNGDGSFVDIALPAGVAYTEEGADQPRMGADSGDYDNDGHLDILLATFQWQSNTLYHNSGGGVFTDVSSGAGIGQESIPYLGMSAFFLDYDNDGYQDIFIANGHLDENVKDYDPGADYAQRNQLFRNNRDGTFSEVTDVSGPGFRLEGVSHGAAAGDYDNDGDVDLFVSNSNNPCSLLRNEGGNRNHWLMVRTVGTESNRDGMGARLRVVSGDLVQTKEVKSSYGYLSSHDLRVPFGLGNRDRVDVLEIRWPSGLTTRIEDIEVDRVLTVIEERD
ncbi:MAG: CRTAC1 family protein [Chloroflexi bacterium]|nr:CRTAC1 family protein [Chloroflexota bacterium]